MKNSEPAEPSIKTWTQQLRRIAPLILGFVGFFAAVWAIRLNLPSSALAGDPSIPTEAPDLAQPTSGVEVTLPDYQSLNPNDGISRWVDISTYSPHRSRVDVLRYTVQPGDAIFGIAHKFDLEPETILWGNYEVLNDDPHMLRVGQELNILPVDGTYYQWQAGDGLESVADFFGVEPGAIIEWPGNGIDFIDPVIEPGAWLIVPGGKRELRRWLVKRKRLVLRHLLLLRRRLLALPLLTRTHRHWKDLLWNKFLWNSPWHRRRPIKDRR